MDETCAPAEVLKELNDLKRNIDKQKEKNDNFIKIKKLMNEPTEVNKELLELEAKFSDRKLLWTHVENPLEAFEQAIENAKPSLEVKSRRIGGATYQVPVEIPPERRIAMAMAWIIQHARAKVGRSTEIGLAAELADCFSNQGATIKKKDDTHRMAEANKAFAHYKW